MKRVLLATSVMLPLVGCATAQIEPLTIQEVAKSHEALDGKWVRLTGWIATCENYSCVMSEQAGGLGAQIRIGYGPKFDKQFLRFGGAEVQVVVEGKVHAGCFDHRNDAPTPEFLLVCTDRAGELDQPRLVRILSAPQVPNPKGN